MVEVNEKEIETAVRRGLIDYRYCAEKGLAVVDATTALAWMADEQNRGVPLSTSFDNAAYLEAYPDVVAEPIHPVIHYLRSGRAEGREAFPVFEATLRALGTKPKAIWIESHELSLTGAPIALSHLLQGWPDLAQRAVIGAPHGGAMQSRFEALGSFVALHGQSARRARSIEDASALIARCRSGLKQVGATHVLGNSALSWPMVMAGLDAGLPTAWIIHEPNADEVRDLVEPTLFDQIHAAQEKVDRLIFVSHPSRNAWHPEDMARAAVIEKALPVSTPGRRDVGREAAKCGAGDTLVLSVGSISPRKGQLDVIQALEQLAETPIATSLVTVLIGYKPSPYAEEVRQKLFDLRQKGLRAFLLPESRTAADRRTVEHLFAAADIFVMSSRAESLPLTTSEAFAAGCPVVSSNVAGIGDLIEAGTTGLLYTPGDIGTLAQHIAALAGSDQLRTEMRHNIASKHSQIDYEEMISHYKAFLGQLF